MSVDERFACEPAPRDGTHVTVPARIVAAPIRLYQLVRAGRPSPCRYDPSCSTYALEALAVHGAGRGSLLTARRLGRCHPWGGVGADPVPAREG